MISSDIKTAGIKENLRRWTKSQVSTAGWRDASKLFMKLHTGLGRPLDLKSPI